MEGEAPAEPPIIYRVAVPIVALPFSLDGEELVTDGYHEVLDKPPTIVMTHD